MKLTVDLSTNAILLALVIFVLRVINNAMGTVRVVLINRGQRNLAAGIGFVESFIFVFTITSIVTDFDNVLNLIAYCGGFSVGSYLGMAIEARFITSYMTVNVITHERGHEIATALRNAGYGVTEHVGEGRDGQVTIIRSVCVNRNVPAILEVVHGTHPQAFVSVEEARHIHRGHVVRASRPLSSGH
jgi:uncharacterized protein YebE (UPF0316 family)